MKLAFEDQQLAGKAAIVTGSGRNIGKAIAKRLARAGASVVINGHSDATAVNAVVKEIEEEGGRAIGFIADVGDPDALASMVDACVSKFGSVDIAVSNVAIRRVQTLLEISVEEWRSILNSNLNASFFMARTVIPHMQKKGWGRIIHISGNDGFNAHSINRAHNIVCKAGVHALTRVLSNEFARFGITANTIAPGRIDTERDFSMLPPNYVAEFTKRVPVGRFGATDEIANVAYFLVTNPFVTGQVIHANGGESTYSS